MSFSPRAPGLDTESGRSTRSGWRSRTWTDRSILLVAFPGLRRPPDAPSRPQDPQRFLTTEQILRKLGLGPVSCGALRQGHGVAEGGEALGMVAGEAVRVQPLEVVAAEFAIRLAVPQDVVGDDEGAVGDGNDGLLVAAALDEPAVLGGEVGVAF